LRVGGLAREVLNTGGLTTRIAIAGMAREVLGAFGDSTDGVGGGPGAGAIAAFASRRRFMQMVEYDPRLAKKLGIRGKLQILD
jgi:hypothetical protein